jgi:hypothetical protein
MILACGDFAALVCDRCAKSFLAKKRDVGPDSLVALVHLCTYCDLQVKNEQGNDKQGGQADAR